VAFLLLKPVIFGCNTAFWLDKTSFGFNFFENKQKQMKRINFFSIFDKKREKKKRINEEYLQFLSLSHVNKDFFFFEE